MRRCHHDPLRVLALAIAALVSTAVGSCVTITPTRLHRAGCLTRGGYYISLRVLRRAAAMGWAIDVTGYRKRPRIAICRGSPLWSPNPQAVYEVLYRIRHGGS